MGKVKEDVRKKYINDIVKLRGYNLSPSDYHMITFLETLTIEELESLANDCNNEISDDM